MDYLLLEHSLTFNSSASPSDCITTVEVNILEDFTVEGDPENFSITLSSSDVLVQFSNESTTVKIQDSDCEYFV